MSRPLNSHAHPFDEAGTDLLLSRLPYMDDLTTSMHILEQSTSSQQNTTSSHNSLLVCLPLGLISLLPICQPTQQK